MYTAILDIFGTSPDTDKFHAAAGVFQANDMILRNLLLVVKLATLLLIV